jgi:hypothetical protein
MTSDSKVVKTSHQRESVGKAACLGVKIFGRDTRQVVVRCFVAWPFAACTTTVEAVAKTAHRALLLCESPVTGRLLVPGLRYAEYMPTVAEPRSGTRLRHDYVCSEGVD